MKKVNSLSGGKTSSYLAVKYPADYNVFSVVCLDDAKCAPKDKSLALYANEKLEKFHSQYGEFIATAEDDRTLAAMMDLEQIIGKEIAWVRGKSFDNLIEERHKRVLLGNSFRLPSWARRYCTVEMKLEPIFYWWLHNIGVKVEMRIGFRFDEFYRLENFLNNSDPCNFSIPVSCATYGQKRQKLETFKWRAVKVPLIKDGITSEDIAQYWEKNSAIFPHSGSMFHPRTNIVFPAISNCVGCFHKERETIAAMSIINPEKMAWFAQQEEKGMGTWLDSREKYSDIAADAKNIAKERLYEAQQNISSCSTGGCTD
jgi:hypothetical protein